MSTVRTAGITTFLTTAVMLFAACTHTPPQADEPSTNGRSTAGPSGSEPTSLRDLEGPIVPGNHRVPLISWKRTYPVDALVEVPDGFITPGGWVVENGQNGTAYGDLMYFGDVGRVDTRPCGAGRLVKPGPSVRDLAEALTAQVPRRTTTPTHVAVGGHHGLYLESSSPRDLNRCEDGQFTLWTADLEDEFHYGANGPGTVFHLWILDVDAQRVVVAVKVVPRHTLNAAELVHMAETTQFVKNVDE